VTVAEDLTKLPFVNKGLSPKPVAGQKNPQIKHILEARS